MRVVFCWAYISGYMAACWRALAKVPGVESVVLTAKYDDPRIPGFDDEIAKGFDCRLLNAQQFVDDDYIFQMVQKAAPQIVVICGWAIQPYTKLAMDSRMAGVKMVMAMDTPWRRTMRQRVARLKIGAYVDLPGVEWIGVMKTEIGRQLEKVVRRHP